MDKKPRKNLDECLEFIIKNNPKEDLDKFAAIKGEDEAVGMFHFGAAMAIRNAWGLWGKNELTAWFNAQGIYHADDMSGIIYKSLHRKLNGRDIDFAGQVKHYQNYWKKLGYKDGIPK